MLLGDCGTGARVCPNRNRRESPVDRRPPIPWGNGAVWRTTTPPQQLATGTPQRLSMKLTGPCCDDMHENYGRRDSAFEMTPQRHARLKVQDRPSCTLSTRHHDERNLSVGPESDGWRKRHASIVAPGNRRSPTIRPVTRVASDGRNRVPDQLWPISKLARDRFFSDSRLQ